MPNDRERSLFLDFLQRRRLRVTQARLALFDGIYEQHRHIDADDLHSALLARGHKISRATVYRGLDLLVECGLVRKQRLGSRRFLYEHEHAGQTHDHLVCGDCGRVVEFLSPGILAMQREICRAHGFSLDHHHLQILGLCDTCRATREANSRPTPETPNARSLDHHPA